MTQTNHEPDFDRVADIYRWAEYVSMGPLLQKTRTHFLPELNDRTHVWVFGDGDGRFLAALLRCHSSITAVAVDISKRMLALLEHRCRKMNNRVRTVRASALGVEPTADIDLVVTHFVLDCLTPHQVGSFVRLIADRCKPGTRWLISDFQVPPKPIYGGACRMYIRTLYFVFRITTGLRVRHLPDARAALIAARFQRIAYHQTLGGLLYTELWELNGAGEARNKV